jgi:hypothetical protein
MLARARTTQASWDSLNLLDKLLRVVLQMALGVYLQDRPVSREARVIDA